MKLFPLTLKNFSNASLGFICCLLVACGGSDSSSAKDLILKEPSNQITHAYFLDQDAMADKISGKVVIQITDLSDNEASQAESIWAYWADSEGNKVGDVWLKTDKASIYDLQIPATTIPENISALLLYPTNSVGQANKGKLIKFRDFTGNALLSGLGGNEKNRWEYGLQRPKIAIKRLSDGLCIFDNGLISVTNMHNNKDMNNHLSALTANQIDDKAFPAESFLCDEHPVYNNDSISDDVGVWTYSAVNDAMFYGTLAYNTAVKYLGEPPWDEKVRLRVHYNHLYDDNAFWDGAYVNFGDAYYQFYSTVSLDIVAHEIAHGVLSRISPLNIFQSELSPDARTVHEAFADISGVMAKYEFTGSNDNWIHGEASHGPTRQLNQIQTEVNAVASYLDYDDAQSNYYLRIGLITYPFYLLSKEWGLEQAYGVYINAAKSCWPTTVTLPQAAQCIKQQAGHAGLSQQAVVNAFKSVKIKLFEEGVLSHFSAEQFKLRVEFKDTSQTSHQVTQWHWDFGDGQVSDQQNPEHTYTQAGTYQVSLSVTDPSQPQAYAQDSFQRTLTISDQYCAINSMPADNQITAVTINGIDMDYFANESDYTNTLVDVSEDKSLLIDIKGDTNSTLTAITWKVWLDLNDNGIFGDHPEELLINETTEASQPYQLSKLLNLSSLANDQTPKYMRISGEYSAITSPCFSTLGEALDLRINW
ncbi:flagellar biosynthesis protein FlgM [Psychromonas sp. psych-6C06]|uniref:PKD domain-containing protein n=1 Tax=Psychromonas sp. psych-6C06 TaxID=2058089 RepID=UPI000C3228EF|nr:PKD domain-containing protein [Psychromonas sp. psych-6C06]PKF61585.1 flagellar biosynthesis protein FlgM [Psychromonas sp. psych-6C06]